MYLNFKKDILSSVTKSKLVDNSIISVLIPDNFNYFDEKIVKDDFGSHSVKIYHGYKTVLKNLENDYVSQRKLEYDNLNQFEMFYNDEVNGTTTWKDSINAIKEKYPKPVK